MNNKTTNESALTADLMITSREHENKDRKDISKLIKLISSSKDVEEIKNHLRGMNDIARNRSMMIIRKREPKLYSDIVESSDKKSMYQQHIDIGKYNESYIEEDNKMEKDKDPCWKKYKMVGMKKKNGKIVPNCVPEAKELHPNQQKLDIHEPEKDELTSKDFEMLRKMKKKKDLQENILRAIKNRLFPKKVIDDTAERKEYFEKTYGELEDTGKYRIHVTPNGTPIAVIHDPQRPNRIKPAPKHVQDAFRKRGLFGEAKELHPNQQKLDVHEPEKDKLTSKDFEMLRKMKKKKIEEASTPRITNLGMNKFEFARLRDQNKKAAAASRERNREGLAQPIELTPPPAPKAEKTKPIKISDEEKAAIAAKNAEIRASALAAQAKKEVRNESIEYLEEKEMTDAQKAKREKYVLSMKKNLAAFEKRYGDRAMDVIYATATKMAMKESVDEDVRVAVVSLNRERTQDNGITKKKATRVIRTEKNYKNDVENEEKSIRTAIHAAVAAHQKNGLDPHSVRVTAIDGKPVKRTSEPASKYLIRSHYEMPHSGSSLNEIEEDMLDEGSFKNIMQRSIDYMKSGQPGRAITAIRRMNRIKAASDGIAASTAARDTKISQPLNPITKPSKDDSSK